MRALQSENHQLILDNGKVLFVLLDEVLLALILIWGPPTVYARTLLSFLSIFIIPGISLTLLFIKDSIDFVRLLFLSLLISPMLAGATTLLLSVTFPPLNRTLFISVIMLLMLTSLLFYAFRKNKLVIVYNKAELVSLSVIFVASLAILYATISLPHMPTPDEDYYVTNARLLLNYGQAFPIPVSFWTASPVTLLNSRILWDSMVASFISSTNISPAYSNCFSLVFLLGVCIASLLLIPEKHRNYALVVTIPLLVLSNIILVMLSSFALNDLAVAFYNIASLIFFINSFRETSGKIELVPRNLLLTLLLQLLVFLIKFNLIFTVPFFLVLVVNIFRFKLYRSTLGKAITLLAILPMLLYELVLDIPRNVALYVFKTRALEFLNGFLPVSPVESVMLMFISEPYNPRTVFNYSALVYFQRFYVLLSPENLTIFIASTAIFLPYLFKKALDNLEFKNMVLVTLLAMLMSFLQGISSGNSGDIPRYYASVIAPLTVVCMIIYFDWINSKLHMMLLPLVGMLFLAWSNNVLTGQYGGVPISWGVGLNETFSLLMLQIILYAALTFALFSLQRNKAMFVFKLPRIRAKSLVLKADKAVFFALILVAIIGNLYLGSIAYAQSPSFRDYGLGTLTNVADQGIVFSNSYALGTYSSNSLFRDGFISSMPWAEEFNSLIGSMPNGTRLVLFKNTSLTGLSESFVGSYPRIMSGEEIILPNNATVWPTETVNSGDIFHAYFLNGNSTVTINGSEVEPTFTNISWTQYPNGKAPYFNGSGSFIEIPHSPTLNVTPPYTIETWVIYEPILGKDAVILDSSTELGGYMLFIRDRKVAFANGFGNTALTTDLTVEPNVWNHIVVSYNGTHSIFYVNGESEVVTGPQFKPLDKEVPMWVGRYHWAFGSEVYYKGIIGVINVYNRLLSSEEVNSNFYNFIKPPYFKLREKISASNGDAFVYELLSPKSLNFSSDKDIIVNKLSWSIENQSSPVPDIVLSLNISSQRDCNATIVISNDAFSRVLHYEVHAGSNNIDLKFESFIYDDNGLVPIGSLIARNSNILVIDDRSNILYKGVTSIFQSSSLQLLAYGLLVVAITLFSLLLATHGKGIELW